MHVYLAHIFFGLPHFLFIDHGNTAVKGMVTDETFEPGFEFTEIPARFPTLAQNLKTRFSIQGGFYSTVGNLTKELKDCWENDFSLTAFSPLLPSPLKSDYLTPETLGPDRFAAAVGAYSLFPGENTLILDFGTCLKIDFVEKGGIFHGGAISPGVTMRYQALHTFTAKLPLLVRPEKFPEYLSGRTTQESLHAGVILGILAEAEGIIGRYEEKMGQINILLTGGDASFFEGRLKNAIFVPQNFVLLGLAETKKYHAKKLPIDS
jgi:type III pantothenate kinase